MNNKYLPSIAALFVASLIITNSIDQKLFAAGGLTLTVGIIIFPLAYVFGDVLTEVYGYATSRKVIWTGFAALLLMILIYSVARALPPSPAWTHEAEFDLIFGRVPRITIASMAAYWVGEFVNSFVVAKMKIASDGRRMGLRFILSTVLGQACDTVIFVGIAFVGILPWSVMPEVILSAWAVKVAWEIVALPLTLYIVRRLKRAEGIDVYDRSTDFNPFSLGERDPTK
ncbi:MAG TPA: queuosine precursor transporter [Allosphingosinicella sp.]|nr:queuosine precursor transporter [Allosphingosinicella sp.]